LSPVVIVDASAVVGYLQAPDTHGVVSAVLADETCTMVVPHLCDLETASAFRSLVRRHSVPAPDAQASIALYAELPLERVEHLPLLLRVFALRENFTPYDAVYVALAEALDAPLLTADLRLAEAVRRFTAVEVIAA
jgi:predicted nucleic acid-binding protein